MTPDEFAYRTAAEYFTTGGVRTWADDLVDLVPMVRSQVRVHGVLLRLNKGISEAKKLRLDKDDEAAADDATGA